MEGTSKRKESGKIGFKEKTERKEKEADEGNPPGNGEEKESILEMENKEMTEEENAKEEKRRRRRRKESEERERRASGEFDDGNGGINEGGSTVGGFIGR